MKSKSSRSSSPHPPRQFVEVLFLSTCFVVPVVRKPCSDRRGRMAALAAAVPRAGTDSQRPPRGMDASDRSIRER
jgi:hypothetical protein